MKRLTILAMLLVALTTGAVAHEGSIGLYTDLLATDCDANFLPYQSYPVHVMYYKSDAGPDGITSAQFKLVIPEGGVVVVQTFEPSPDVSVTIGNITDPGISCSFQGCNGTGQDLILIGTVTLFPIVAVPMQFSIAASDDISPADPPIAPRVSICDVAHSIRAVLGGWYSTPDGSCNIGTEESSWGAIKDMYRN